MRRSEKDRAKRVLVAILLAAVALFAFFFALTGLRVQEEWADRGATGTDFRLWH